MTLHPEVQRKAQEEIDRVIGNKRLPSMEDRENLPYVNAIVKEVFRWHPVGPMGLPHMTTQDDVFNGYLIPKGAIILANIWYALISFSTLRIVFLLDLFTGGDCYPFPSYCHLVLTLTPSIGASHMTQTCSMTRLHSSQNAS